jgi:hypothetical protein
MDVDGRELSRELTEVEWREREEGLVDEVEREE